MLTTLNKMFQLLLTKFSQSLMRFQHQTRCAILLNKMFQLLLTKSHKVLWDFSTKWDVRFCLTRCFRYAYAYVCHSLNKMFQLLLTISNQFLQDLTPNDQMRCAILLKEMSHLAKQSLFKEISLNLMKSHTKQDVLFCLKRCHILLSRSLRISL